MYAFTVYCQTLIRVDLKMKLFCVAILIALSATVKCQDTPRKILDSPFQTQTYILNFQARCLLPEYLPEQQIRCMGYMPMYRYDDVSKKCIQFIYGGCGGTENKFGSIKECIDTCGAKNVLNPPGNFSIHDIYWRKLSSKVFPARCLQPEEAGRCFAAFPKFFFNQKDGACKEFIYGGCDANENNFETVEECKKACEVYDNEFKHDDAPQRFE